MEVVAAAPEVDVSKENILKQHVLRKDARLDELLKEIKLVAEDVRLRRANLKEAGIPWRSDETTMEKVFLLMKLKFSHPQFRHETLPEKEVGVVIKLRWKVVVDGKVVVLQRPFRQTPSLSDVQIREAVAAYTLKKCPGLEPFERILMVLDKTNKCELAKEVRLNMTFPGPKFETKRVVRLECENTAWVKWCKEKPARAESHMKKLEEDKQRVEARKAAKREAKAEAAQAGAGPKGKAPKGPKGPKGAKKAVKKVAAKK